MPNEVRYLTVDDVAELLHVKRETVCVYHRHGRLPPPVKVGRRLLWRSDQREALMAGPARRVPVRR
jgi:predicted DNA-binding transcriptional regulator AlpA